MRPSRPSSRRMLPLDKGRFVGRTHTHAVLFLVGVLCVFIAIQDTDGCIPSMFLYFISLILFESCWNVPSPVQ